MAIFHQNPTFWPFWQYLAFNDFGVKKVQNNGVAPGCRINTVIPFLFLARQEFALFLSGPNSGCGV